MLWNVFKAADSYMKQVVIVISHLYLFDQLNGFSGSSGPFQSTISTSDLFSASSGLLGLSLSFAPVPSTDQQPCISGHSDQAHTIVGCAALMLFFGSMGRPGL